MNTLKIILLMLLGMGLTIIGIGVNEPIIWVPSLVLVGSMGIEGYFDIKDSQSDEEEKKDV